MKRLILLLLLFYTPFASGATLHGSVYDLDFDIVDSAVVEIDSKPMQSMISRDGSYSFELNVGDYILDAKYYIGQELVASTQEEISIVKEGDYVIDLILFPTFDSSIGDDFDVDFSYRKSLWWIWTILIVSVFVLYIIFKKRPKKKIDEDDELNGVLNFIKKQGGRTTQKEIRKNLGLGEAKASLIITELEYKKIVHRIKKGRGNIIILNK